MNALRIAPIPFEVFGHPLLQHENFAAYRRKFPRVFGPRGFLHHELFCAGEFHSRYYCRVPAQTPDERPTSLIGPVLVLVLLSFIWGYAWVVVKVGLRHAGVLDFSALRVVVGSVSLFACLRLAGRPLRPAPLIPTLVMALTTTVGFTALSSLAVLINGPGKASVLVFSMPFWTLLFAWPVLGERLRGIQWLAVGLAFGGLTLILRPWQLGGSPLGNLCAILAGVSWAASSVYAKWLTKYRPDIELHSLNAWQMLWGMFPLLLLALAVPAPPVVWNAQFIAALAFAGALATAGGWMMWMYLIQRLPAGAAGMSTLAIPVVAVVAAWLQLGDRPLPGELAGMLAVVAGLAILATAGLANSRRLRHQQVTVD